MDRPIHPLRIANFRAYWGSRLAGTIGTTAQGIIIGWQVYSIARQTMDIKQAAFLLGMIGLAQFLPLFLLTPLVGLTADSFDRRWIVRLTTLVLIAIAAMLGVLTWAGVLGLPALFGAAVLVGTARAFSGPAYSALAPNLVPRDSLPTAIALSSIAWQVGTIAGPSIGGLLYAIHPETAYAAVAALQLVALIVAGGADMVSVYIRSSLIQLHTPDAMRGRVGAVSQLTISASNELGEAESGLLASMLGPVGAVTFGGVAAIVVTLLWARLYPELKLAKTFDPPEIPETIPQYGAAQP